MTILPIFSPSARVKERSPLAVGRASRVQDPCQGEGRQRRRPRVTSSGARKQKRERRRTHPISLALFRRRPKPQQAESCRARARPPPPGLRRCRRQSFSEFSDRSLHGNRRLNDPAALRWLRGIRRFGTFAVLFGQQVGLDESRFRGPAAFLPDPCGVGCASDFATPPCETVASESPLGAAETLAATALAVDVPACFSWISLP